LELKNNMRLESKSATQTKKIGESFAKEILKLSPQEGAVLVCLEGNLGGGKTTFAQGFAKGLGIKEKILSPTFIIYRKFQIPRLRQGFGGQANQKPNFKKFYHFDCYRIKDPKDILGLGFKEIISNPENIVLIEWAEKIKKFLPKNVKWINFKLIDESARAIDFI
jgi:tRNA threonylcarbamoyladenosine biosynthesis protein TsaE